MVVGAGEKLGETGAEGDFSGGGHTCADGDHVLLSDFTFDETVGVVFVVGEGFGEGGVGDIGVEDDDILVGGAEGSEGDAVSFAGGEFSGVEDRFHVEVFHGL